MGAPAGWYPDAERPQTLRYWDGNAWTEHRAPIPVAPVAPAVAHKSNAGTVLVIVGIVVVALIAGPAILGLLGSRSSSGTGGTVTTTNPMVVYEFEGTAGGGSITYSTPTGQEQKDIALPGTITYRSDGSFQTWVSLVQNMGDTGSVTCRIKVDGRVVSENTSSAAYGIATCTASTD